MFEFQVDPEVLLGTVAGITTITYISVQFVKQLLRNRYGVTDDMPDDHPAKRDYAFWLNVIAIVLGLAWAEAAAFIFGAEGQSVAETVLSGAVTGIIAAAVSVGVHEFGSNAISKFQ